MKSTWPRSSNRRREDRVPRYNLFELLKVPYSPFGSCSLCNERTRTSSSLRYVLPFQVLPSVLRSLCYVAASSHAPIMLENDQTNRGGGRRGGHYLEPENDIEVIFSNVCLMLALLTNAIIIGSATTLLSNMDAGAVAKKTQMDGINGYMRFRKVTGRYGGEVPGAGR